MLQRVFLLLLLVSCLHTPAPAQKSIMNNRYQKEWGLADSLLNQGLPQSAVRVARDILKDAEGRKDGPNALRARLFLLETGKGDPEDAGAGAIKEAEAYILKATGVEKAIWQSITAQLYWNYLQQNRWKLYQRTTMAETTSEDINTWDVPAFFRRIGALYQASVSDRETLMAVPVEQYLPVIEEGANTRQLRPAMFDLLAFRAIAFFQYDEKELTQPADRFTIEGAMWFEPAPRFSELKVKVKDAAALHFQALKLYQQVLAAHGNDARPDALIDADLQRLDFVYRNSVHPDKEKLYGDALRQLEQQYKSFPAVAQVSYTILARQWNDGAEMPYGRQPVPAAGGAKKERDLPAMQRKLRDIIARYPGSEGAVNAHDLLQAIEAVTLNVTTEEVNLPGAPFRALIGYRNGNKAYLSVYRLPHTILREWDYNNTETLPELLKTLQPLSRWEQALPGAEDMEAHSTEVKVSSLPPGNYLLVASTGNSREDGSAVVAATPFQVSSLAFILDQEEGGSKGYLLHRKTGYPLSGVKAVFWTRKYNNKQSRYDAERIGTAVSDAAGVLSMTKGNSSSYEGRLQAVTLIKGDDTLQLDGYFNVYNYNRALEDKPVSRTFFFTDRALYRPGQTIYFKGIMLESSKGNRDNKVMAGQQTTVALYDVNNQQVGQVALTSNAYGSFTGTFTAPEGGITGQMSLRNENGSTYFSVEEYKRPKFYVAFDTLKDSYALNSEVKVKAFAKAYAGNNIDGATVKYRVVRRARFPYYWCYYYWGMPSSSEMEITSGTAVTGSDGAVEISFRTIPDKTVDPRTLPVFTYQVYADITDVNGETRSGTMGLSAGYRSLLVSTELKEESGPEDLTSIPVQTTNLNGVFVSAMVKVTVARLQFPGFYRKRLWGMPDQFVMSEQEFHTAFPDDEYRQESDHLNWEAEPPSYQQTLTTAPGSAVAVPESTWYRNGWYVVTLSTKDAQGNEILEKKYVHVWAPGKKEPVQQDLVLYAEKDSYQPGETLELWRATAVDNPYLMVRVARANGSLSVDPSKNPLTFALTEEDRGGLAFNWLYIANNRVYTGKRIIEVPWTNKELLLEWATHRSNLQPGAGEEWTLTIKGVQKEAVAAELLAGMYDASLDAFRMHNWSWNRLFPSVYAHDSWSSNYGFGAATGRIIKAWSGAQTHTYEKRYDNLLFTGNIPDYGWGGNSGGRRYKANVAFAEAAPGIAPVTEEMASSGMLESRRDDSRSEADAVASGAAAPEKAGQAPVATVQPRKNFNETAFFIPQLTTDADGNIKLRFTMPEALTEWKFMAFAHTTDWKTGYLEGKIKTQKDLMVVPNLPRFLRQNDDIEISTKISNLSEKVLNGEARLELLDAATLQPLDLSFRLKEGHRPFRVAAGQSTTVAWMLHIPESRYMPVLVRITARAGTFSDGEEHLLPVITNRALVTETLPLPVRGNQEKAFSLDKLVQNSSTTLANHALTVEFTANPAWYAVQALPYLMEYPYECAEQTFNRYYANALAGYIVSRSPKVAKVFRQWQDKDSAALLSALQKNEDLKSALLEETPWVMDARDEQEQKRRVALLFATHRLARELDKNLAKLEQMQLGDGSFPWFKGMQGNRYITQYIVTGLGRLQHLGVSAASGKKAEHIIRKALPYLDRLLKEDYELLLKNKAVLSKQHIGHSQVQYLYMRSFFTGEPAQAGTEKALAYYKKQAAAYWNTFNPYGKGQLALALKRSDDAADASRIMASLRETASSSDEMGMYWAGMPSGYWWYEAPVEAQSLLIEAFTEVGRDQKAVDAMKVWLLKQKQTRQWKTTKATADACYALLLNGSEWLDQEPEVTIHLGKEVIRSAGEATEAGTGYFSKRFEGSHVQNDMGAISVKVDNGKRENSGVSWGAVYWQYFEELDKITPAATPLSLKKQLFIEQNSDRGPVLTEIKTGNFLKVGDKVKVRIELRADRDMEYVHLKDMRAACMEPVNVLSGYRYQGGLGYYESTRDASSNFFFDYLRKGTYVFEYTVFVTAKGNFSNGIATIQCMYAPEFSSHSEGSRVEVR